MKETLAVFQFQNVSRMMVKACTLPLLFIDSDVKINQDYYSIGNLYGDDYYNITSSNIKQRKRDSKVVGQVVFWVSIH
jgi:hypothetical protein